MGGGILPKVGVESIGLKVVNAKLLLAAPRILEQNRLMTTAILEEIKPIVAEQTPIGPGHFGYHGRDTLRVDVKTKGATGTVGVLKGARQMYWREFGTRGRFRKSALLGTGKGARARLLESFGGAGERAFLTAHRAAGLFKRVVNFYYGGYAKWWRI